LRKRFDLFIGYDVTFGVWGLLLRGFGVVRRVIVISADFFPSPAGLSFDSLFVHLWRLLDLVVQNSADVVWYTSEELMEAKRREGLLRSRRVERHVVPLGVDGQRVAVNKAEVDRKRLIYCGRLEDDIGLTLVLDALHDVVLLDPSAKLAIIGSGSEEHRLKVRARELGIEGSVEFRGFVKDENEVMTTIAHSGIGLAPYAPSPDGRTHYADPGKVKVYIEAGIPIIMTRISSIAEEVETRGAGLVVDFDRDALRSAIEALLEDEILWERMKANVLRMARDYDYEAIYDRYFQLT
jgi:glycosyltransferase involved in cell wall biosynthesis